jgi:hypothetical protein
MARRPSIGEVLVGGVVVAMVVFVASQVVASPRRRGANPEPVLSGRDSAAIATQYHAQIDGRRPVYTLPTWLADIQIARLQGAAARDVAGHDPIDELLPDSIAALLAASDQGTYLRTMLTEDRDVVTRWRPSADPIRVWVQPHSAEKGFSPELISPTRRAFTAWNEVPLGVTFEIVEDSTAADTHVTWSASMPGLQQLGTTFRMTGATGWIAFAHVILSTSYDIYTVQNAARHEAGHVLGLGHSPNVSDIMAAATEGRQYQLTDADRGTATWLYQLPPGKIR